MPTRDGYPQGVPSWADLVTPDVEGAKAFYGELFGWEYSQEASDSMPYTMAYRKGMAAAGIGDLPDGSQMPTVWSTYFAVDNVDTSIAAISKAGGSIMMGPMDVTDAGRMAFALDPTGAVFGIWQAGTHFGAAIVNEHGAMNWNELISSDLDKALPFYEAVFGHTFETAQTPTGPYTAISAGDRAVAGAMPKPKPEIPDGWGVYFAVDDAKRAVETVTNNGGKLDYYPMEIPDIGVITGVADPYGAHFTVIQLAQPVD